MKRIKILQLAALLLQPAFCSGLANSNLSNFQASGPVSLTVGQNARVCATNLDNSPVSVVIALFAADTGGLLAVNQQQLSAGGGACLNFLASPNQQAGGDVVGLVVTNAHLNASGGIVQVAPPGSGGCIAASVQIQAMTINNSVGQTFLYVPMKDFQEEVGRQDQGDRK